MSVIVDPENGTQYNIIGRLGSGAFGEVYKARSSARPRTVAIKIINCFSERAARDADREARLHGMIDHRHIVKCFQVIFLPHYNGSMAVCLVEEFCNQGSLADRIRARTYDIYRDTRSWLLQLLLGLSKIHQFEIIHRDIKAENVLIKNNIVKIADLGVSVARFKSGAHGLQLHRTLNGDQNCVAPEMYLGRPYDLRVDVFGVGVILLGLLTGRTKPTFQNMPIGYAVSRNFRLKTILRSKNIRSNNPFYMPLTRMLAYSPTSRFSAGEAYEAVSHV